MKIVFMKINQTVLIHYVDKTVIKSKILEKDIFGQIISAKFKISLVTV